MHQYWIDRLPAKQRLRRQGLALPHQARRELWTFRKLSLWAPYIQGIQKTPKIGRQKVRTQTLRDWKTGTHDSTVLKQNDKHEIHAHLKKPHNSCPTRVMENCSTNVSETVKVWHLRVIKDIGILWVTV